MRTKKLKRSRRILDACADTVGLASPLPVLVDSSFAKVALRHRVNMRDQLGRLLAPQELRLCTTRCVIKECELLGSIMAGTLKVLSALDLHPCDHRPTTAVRCLTRALRASAAPVLATAAEADADAPWRPLLASNSEPLRALAHRCTGLPCLLLERGQPLLTGLPASTRRLLAERRLRGLRADAAERHQQQLEQPAAAAGGLRKRKRQRGPNPLSCLPPSSSTSSAATKQQQQRHHRGDGGDDGDGDVGLPRRRRRGCRAGERRRPWHMRRFREDLLAFAEGRLATAGDSPWLRAALRLLPVVPDS